MPALYLIRHAHADWQPSDDRPLSAQGLRQAQRVDRVLEAVRPEVIYSSPARRAMQTVQPIAERRGLAIRLEPDLRERELSSEPVGHFDDAVRATWSSFDFAYPGGETNRAAQERALAVLRRLARSHTEPVIVGTHGNLLALVLAAVDASLGFDFWHALSFPDIFRLELEEPLEKSCFERIWTDGVEPF